MKSWFRIFLMSLIILSLHDALFNSTSSIGEMLLDWDCSTIDFCKPLGFWNDKKTCMSEFSFSGLDYAWHDNDSGTTELGLWHLQIINLKDFLIVTTLVWLSGDMPSSPASDFNIPHAFGHVIFRTSISSSITWKFYTWCSLKPSQRSDMLNFDFSWFHLLS